MSPPLIANPNHVRTHADTIRAAWPRGVLTRAVAFAVLCRQHEWEADAIACAALARAGVPAERWADVARVLGWRPKRELKVGRLQLTLLSDADPATEADLRRLAAAILKLAGVMRRVGRASEADALLLRHTSCPETEQLWLWGLPPADREAILLQLMQTHPPLEQRRERILRLAARHELREAEQARG